MASADTDAPPVIDTEGVALVDTVPGADGDAAVLPVRGAVPVTSAEPVMGVSDGVTVCEIEIEGEEEGERDTAGVLVVEGDAVPVIVTRAEPVTVWEAVTVAELVTVGGELGVKAAPVGVAASVTVTVGLLLGGRVTVPECVSVPETDDEGDSEALTVEEGEKEELADTESVADTQAEAQLVADGVASEESDTRMEGVWLTEAQCEDEKDVELDTEDDLEFRKEPVSTVLAEKTPEKDGSGVAQGVTLCVLCEVWDTELEGVPLGEPLTERAAERVNVMVTETVSV